MQQPLSCPKGRGKPMALMGLPFASVAAAPCIPVSLLPSERGR